jgi:branched-chain amino acid aminotransferase
MEKDWFPRVQDPDKDLPQLHVRLVHYSTENMLGIRTSFQSKMFGIVNPLILDRQKVLRLKCTPHVYKNWPLGHGQYRVGGNFGPLVPALRDAVDNGFDDILWLLDGYIKELTFANVFMLLKTRYGHYELLVPPNDHCIYNGIFR